MTNPVSQEEAIEALGKLLWCAETLHGIVALEHHKTVKNFIQQQSDWQPIETRPTAENAPFMVLLPKNDVADFVQLQVTIFEGQMYPDALSGMIDWWSWVGPEQTTHWRPCFDVTSTPKGSPNDQ